MVTVPRELMPLVCSPLGRAGAAIARSSGPDFSGLPNGVPGRASDSPGPETARAQRSSAGVRMKSRSNSLASCAPRAKMPEPSQAAQQTPTV